MHFLRASAASADRFVTSGVGWGKRMDAVYSGSAILLLTCEPAKSKVASILQPFWFGVSREKVWLLRKAFSGAACLAAL